MGRWWRVRVRLWCTNWLTGTSVHRTTVMEHARRHGLSLRRRSLDEAKVCGHAGL